MMSNCDFTTFHWWGGGWMGHTAWTVLLVLGAIIALWCLAKRNKSGSPTADRFDSLEILKVRLARGEITIEEYNTLKGVL